MVSAIASRSTPLSRATVTMSSTRCGGVGPSNGQSHAVATMTSTDDAAVVRDGDDLADQCGCLRSGAADVGRLCPSAAETTYSMDRRPAAIARLAPFGLATSAENSMPCEVRAAPRRVRRHRPGRAPSTARRTPSPPSPARRWRRPRRAVRAWPTTGSGLRSADRRAARHRGCRHVSVARSYARPPSCSVSSSASVLPSRPR